MKYVILILGVYIGVVQSLSHFGYLVCKQRKGKSTKECRNINCDKGRVCPYNSLY